MKVPRTLRARPAALALAAAILLLAACTTQLNNGPSARTSPSSSGSRTAPIPVESGTPATGAGFDAARVAQVLGPSVAMIIVNTRGGVAEGTGFVIQSGGGASYLLTNNHVVAGGSKVQVLMPDGRHWVADVQGTDPLEDIAVLKVPDTLPVAQFADSTKLAVGQSVEAIGTPLGNSGSVTVGVISAVHRTVNGIGGGAGTPTEDLPDAIQTDAPINQGNSGGPLADAAGRVVGVNTAAASGANSIGYAIPSLVAKRVAEDLIAGRTPGHPYIGICYSTIENALASGSDVKGYGIVISKALSGTPADKAGLRAGDVVEKIDGTDLNNGQTLGGVIQLHRPGDTVSLAGLRGGGTLNVSVTLGDRPSSPAAC